MPLTKRELLKKARKIKLIVLDADGVLTDGKISYATAREWDFEMKAFHAHDGFGITRAIKLGILVSIITGRRSRLLVRRADELGIRELSQGAENKLPGYVQLKRRHRLRDEEMAYMGDDVPDLVLLERAGLSAATNSAVPEVKRSVDYVSTLSGGEGAVREFIDFILRAQKRIP